MKKSSFLFTFFLSSISFAQGNGLVIFGDIIFGEPISIRECTTPNYSSQVKPSNQSCFKKNSLGGIYEFSGTSETPRYIKPGYDVSIEYLDGVVADVTIITGGVSVQNLALVSLTEKFGKPTTIKKTLVKTNTGGTFEAIDATWLRHSVLVSFNSPAGDVMTGIISISTHEFLANKKKNAMPKKAL